MPVRATLACLLAAIAAPAPAAVETYAIDPVHTRIVFSVDHAGFSKALGTFSGSTGVLAFDPDDWAGTTLDVTIPLASLEIGDAKWRTKVLDRTFLDAESQPLARFVSTRVEPGVDGKARLLGQLTLRGVSREVALDVTLNAIKRHPMTFRRTAGFSATGRLSRSEFGMDAWRNVVGDEVGLIIEVEATRSRRAKPAAATENTDADQEP